MPAPRRIVIDPNVLVSAAVTPAGATATVTDLNDAGIIIPIVSPKLLAELDGVLRREKFRHYLSPQEVEAYVSELTRRGELWDDPPEPPTRQSGPAATRAEVPYGGRNFQRSHP